MKILITNILLFTLLVFSTVRPSGIDLAICFDEGIVFDVHYSDCETNVGQEHHAIEIEPSDHCADDTDLILECLPEMTSFDVKKGPIKSKEAIAYTLEESLALFQTTGVVNSSFFRSTTALGQSNIEKLNTLRLLI
jgi:hypothetical protein